MFFSHFLFSFSACSESVEEQKGPADERDGLRAGIIDMIGKRARVEETRGRAAAAKRQDVE